MKLRGRKILLITALAVICLGFGSLSWAQMQQQKVVAPKQLIKLQIPVDPYIYTVCANNHYCDQALSGVDALLLQHITVVVGNHQCPNQKGYTATGEVTVSFFSYTHGQVLTKTVPFSVDCFKEQTILVFPGLYLIKKSSGISASITKLGPNQIDCNPGNNTKTMNQWMSCAVVK
jgi:hypothetical protein